jgi:hypothetical protein
MGVFICCLYFSLCLFQWSFSFYAIQQVAQAGWSPVLFSYAGNYSLFTMWFCYILIILILWSHNQLFIWLDPEVVAHDYANKSGYLNFLLDCRAYFLNWMEFYILFHVWPRSNDDLVLQKKFKYLCYF